MKCILCENSLFKKEKYFFGFSINSKYIYICNKCNLGKIKYDKNLIKNFYALSDSKIVDYNFSLNKVKSESPVHIYLEAGKKYTNINNVLDIGSGNGHFLFSVQQNQIDYLGIEPSTQKVENSKKIGVNKVLNVGLEEFLDNNNLNQKFDLIFLNQVFEHLEDPLLKLKKLKNLLSKNGIIIIVVPNCNKNYYQCRADDHAPHLTFWNESSLKLMANKMDFISLEMGSCGHVLKKNNFLRLKNIFRHLFGWFIKDYLHFLYSYLKEKKTQKITNIKVITIKREINNFLNSYNLHQLHNNNFDQVHIYTILKNKN